MSATFSKLGPLSVGSSLSGFGPHIEELHAFFETRGVTFGSVEDLKPFVDRLDSDSAFRDEIGSMLRTIIYRERDGLSWAELMELLAAAVGGPTVEEAAGPDERDAVRRLMVFVEGVFRMRRNPGAATIPGSSVPAVREAQQQEKPAEQQQKVVASPVVQEEVTAKAAETAQEEHPKIDRFYRARASADEPLTLVEDRAAEAAETRAGEDVPVEAETVLHPDLRWNVPFEHFEDQVRTERGSPAWLWVAGICALMLAFCAGLFVHQRLTVPLRDPSRPYEAPQAASGTSAPTTTDTAMNPVTPPVDDGVALKAVAGHGAVAGAPVVDSGDANLQPKYMAPAKIGASHEVMESRLEYAPPPAYPMMAEMTRTQGKVTVEAVVGKDGRVIRAQAISGHHLLRGAAVREVFGRRYRPYILNNRPIDVATLVTVDFRLRPRQPLP